MTVHPAVRLGIPAALLLILIAAPRDRVVAAGDAALSPLLDVGQAPPPEVPLDELFHELAAPGAQVTVVEFSDFGCQYCRQFDSETFPALREEFVETGRVRWRFVPFILGMFPNAPEAMREATCVAERSEEAVWTMREALFAMPTRCSCATPRRREPRVTRSHPATGTPGRRIGWRQPAPWPPTPACAPPPRSL